MSSIGHPGRPTIGLTITLLVALLQLAMPHAVGAADDYAIDEETITITVNVELGGAGANAAIQRKWTKAFNDHWGQDAGPFTNGCRKVVLVPNIVMPGKGNNNYHLVAVVPKDPGHGVRSKVAGEADYRPSEQNRLGNWAGNLPPEDVAHEFGHVLGLADEYLDVDANGKTVPRGTGVRSIPDPSIRDSKDSIMGLGTKVLPRHLVQIVKKHNIPKDKLRCHWKGTYEYRMDQTVPAGGLQLWRADLKISLEEDDSGLRGTVEGNLTQDLQTSSCPSTTEKPAVVRAEVRGKRTQPAGGLPATMELLVISETWTELQVSPCPGAGRPGVYGRIYGFAESLKRLERREGDEYRYHRTEALVIPYTSTSVSYTIVVRRVRGAPAVGQGTPRRAPDAPAAGHLPEPNGLARHQPLHEPSCARPQLSNAKPARSARLGWGKLGLRARGASFS